MNMTRCPKCNYVRTPQDAGIPDWQCPSCGVAYAKFDDTSVGVKPKQGYDPRSTHFENLQQTARAGSSIGSIVVLVLFVLVAIVVYGVTRPTPQQIQNTAGNVTENTDVVLYSTQRCGYCRQARALLAYHKVDYVEKDIEASLTAQQEFRQLNGRGVPVLVIGGAVLHGYSQQRIVQTLHQAGLLAEK